MSYSISLLNVSLAADSVDCEATVLIIFPARLSIFFMFLFTMVAILSIDNILFTLTAPLTLINHGCK